jgi:hypothetical protein
MIESLGGRDLQVLETLRKLGGSASPHRIGGAIHGPAGRADAKVRPTLQRLERLGYVKRSSWLSSVETWTIVAREAPSDMGIKGS